MLIGFFTTEIPVIATICAVLYLPYGIYINKKYGRQSPLCHIVKYAFLGCCFSLLFLTILYYYPHIEFFPGYYFYNLTPFVWVFEVYTMGVEKMIEQLILNIGMFIPYGLLLPLAIKRARKTWITPLLVLGTTVLIETVQLFMGRSADIDDVIMNFLGGIIGYMLFLLLNKLFSNKKRWRDISLNIGAK